MTQHISKCWILALAQQRLLLPLSTVLKVGVGLQLAHIVR